MHMHKCDYYVILTLLTSSIGGFKTPKNIIVINFYAYARF
jgi:hypothetical protein